LTGFEHKVSANSIRRTIASLAFLEDPEERGTVAQTMCHSMTTHEKSYLHLNKAKLAAKSHRVVAKLFDKRNEKLKRCGNRYKQQMNQRQ
jgi:phage regulator Rha-like protein